jgi:multiple sugar transport system permease protein
MMTSQTSSLKRNILRKKRWTKEAILGFTFALIPLLAYVFFNAFPLGISFVAMFTEMEGFKLNTMQWNSFENFKYIFNQDRFWTSIWMTFWIASSQIMSLLVALFIAAVLDKKAKGSRIFQVLFYIPYICSSVSTALMWRWMVDPNCGLINELLGTNINYLANVDNPNTITWTIILMIVWQAPGYGIVIYKSAFDAVNPALYEAANIDGANALQSFFHISLPAVRPMTFFLLEMGIIAGLTTYDKVLLLVPPTYTLTAGLEDRGLTLMYYIDILGIRGEMKIHLASVVSWFLFVLTAFLFIFMKKVQKKVEGD